MDSKFQQHFLPKATLEARKVRSVLMQQQVVKAISDKNTSCSACHETIHDGIHRIVKNVILTAIH